MAGTNGNIPRYLSTEQAADLLGFSVEHLRRVARKPGGPPTFKLGRLLRFDRTLLEAWVEDHRRDPVGS